MNIPNKLIKELSAPLMAITLIFAMQIVGSGSVHAQQCPVNEPNRCDKDGDCFIKNSGLCRRLNPDATADCDDGAFDLSNTCNGGGGSGTLTVDLTGGAFMLTGSPFVVTVFDPGDDSSNVQIQMDRPGPLAVCPGDALCAMRATWDAVFAVCSELLSGPPASITVAAGNAAVSATSGDIRLILNDIALEQATVTLQFIGPGWDPATYPPSSGVTVEYPLTQFGIFGRSNKGGKGGSKGCRPRGSGSFDVMDLLVPGEISITAP